MTEASIEAVLPHMQKVSEYAVKCFAEQIKQLLPPANQDLAMAIDNITMPELFSGLTTTHMQLSWIRANYQLVEGTEYELPPKIGDNSTYCKSSFVYVSILQQIEQILNVRNIYEEIYEKNTHHSARQNDLLSCFQDGEYFKNSRSIQQNSRCLLILLYLDEVCNPLGSKTQHKLLFVYMTFLNFPSAFRSSLKTIFLVAIYYAKQAKEHGYNEILKPIVDHLKQLVEGVNLNLFGEEKQVRGILIAIIADNLASHEVGGFKACFNMTTFRRCRTCLAVLHDMQTSFCDLLLIYRTIDQHEEQCKLLETPTLREHYSKTYGVTHLSVFNDLRNYHVIGGLPPDVMHDLLEGIVPSILAITIKSLISLGRDNFQLKDLNKIIMEFEYGPNEVRNKPSEISKAHLENGKLRQSSSQVWTLMVLLPIMVVDSVPSHHIEASVEWRLLKMLIKISQISFSDEISNYDLLMLKSTVHDFLEAAVSLNINVTPKTHNLVNYGYYILNLGPLRQYWCMRFESKHAYFKTLTRTCGNFKNLPLTLAKRHQIWMLEQLHQKTLLTHEITLSSCDTKFSFERITYRDKLAPFVNCAVDCLQPLKWIQINSTRLHREKTFLLCPVTNNSVKKQFGLTVGLFSIANDAAKKQYFLLLSYSKLFVTMTIMKVLRSLRANNSVFTIFSLFNFHGHFVHINQVPLNAPTKS